MSEPKMYAAVVVGGGPAGLACALWLGRYRRSVCVFDTTHPRNRPAWGVHGFPGLVDPPPLELRARMREQAVDAGAEHRIARVTRIDGEKDAFDVALDDGDPVRARRIVLAYGLRDFVPDVPGIHTFYGHSVYHCPDCDGPSVQDQRVGVIGCDSHAAALALYLLTWTTDITIFANGQALDLSKEATTELEKHSIGIRSEPIAALSGRNGCLEQVTLASAPGAGVQGGNGGDGDGDVIPIEAIFFHLGSEPACDFAAKQGCKTDKAGYLDVDRGQQTSVPGIYAAGDIAGHPHLAIAAAAEGVRAALAIHRSLLPDAFFVGNT